MKKPTDMDLMLYFDGELSPEEEAEVRAALADDPDAGRKLEAVGQIGESVRTSLELDTDEVDHRLGAELWDLVERRLSANGQAEAATAAPRPAVRDEAAPGLWAQVRAWFASNRGYVMTSAVTAGAVAVLVLVLRPPVERVVEKQGPERIVQVPAPSQDPVVPVANEPAAVEELSVTDGTGYILTIPGEGGENDTTVIWIEPEESNLEGPI